VFLFKPADAINVQQGGDNGTPTQKDEPQAQNPPNGASIDYYLKTPATGPVTLEIQDGSGACLAMFSNDPAASACPGAAGGGPGATGGGAGRGGGGRGGGAGGGIPNTSALWRPAPEPFKVSAGMHRVTWAPGGGSGRGFGGGGGGGRGGRGGAPASGTFTAKLTVNGQSHTQTFTVKPDPRLK
jgi:hypothetical protein